MKKALVTTTINVPTLLKDYCRDFVEFGYKDEIEIVVAGDLKTPVEARTFCENLQIKYGIKITYLGFEEQNLFLPEKYRAFLPWNCIQRRNVAILYAYYAGAEIIYTIDDDNFLHTKDYIGSHGKLGSKDSLTAISTDTNWYNICQHLIEQFGKKFYHRGYSFLTRGKAALRKTENKEVRCVVNAGLWLGDPDVDAVTRMAISPNVIGSDFAGKYALDLNTKSPFNSQNTALHRDVIPAYCLGFGLGRYDDIVASYFVKRIADHLGDYISFGLPLVKQNRNDHCLFKDFEQEKIGMQLIDDIVDWLYSIELKGKTYAECIDEIINSRQRVISKKLYDSGTEFTEFIDNMNKNYVAWQEVLKELNKH